MNLDCHAPSPPSAAHELLVVELYIGIIEVMGFLRQIIIPKPA